MLKDRIIDHAKALGIEFDFSAWYASLNCSFLREQHAPRDEDMLVGLEFDVALMCVEDEALTNSLLTFIDELTVREG